MDMIIWRNVLTLVEIAAGYGLLCVYLPSLCLRDYVQDKPLTYRFIFYQVCANMYLILWGFVLAFLKCFNTLTLWLTLVLLPLAATAWRRRETVTARFLAIKETAETILTGMYGLRTLWRNLILSLRRRCKHIYRNYIKGHVWELLGLCVISALVLCFLAQYHLIYEGFNNGDQNVHFNWEQELLHGNSFPDGMYPFGQHFLVAALSGLFNLQLIRTSMVIGPFNMCLLFCVLYLVLKETFSSRSAVLFGICFFILTNIFSYAAYSRYQGALPMEMGLIPYCTIFYGLQRYVESHDRRDMLIFILSVGWCIHIHFYSAILAVFSCVAFGIAFLIPMLKRKVLHRILIGGIIGALLGALPFGIGLALGYPFHGSMNWALSVIQESEENESVDSIQENLETESIEETEALQIGPTITEILNAAFWTVNSKTARALLLILDAIMLLWGTLGAIVVKQNRLRYLMFIFWGLAWLIGLGISTGVITLIQRFRFATFFSFLTVPLFVIPAQLIYNLVRVVRIRPKIAEAGLVAVSLAFFFFMVRDGYIKNDQHGPGGIISEGDIKACYRLMEDYPKQTWTVVSTTYDLALVRYYGFHYEIIDVLKKLDTGNGSLHLPLVDDRIYVPTKDIFIVVETEIDLYDTAIYHSDGETDPSTAIDRGKPTPELALTNLPETSLLNNSSIYAYPWRSVVMSKLYYWMEKVKEAYPNEVAVFYQDDTVTVYHIRQDEYFPMDLMLDYQSDLL